MPMLTILKRLGNMLQLDFKPFPEISTARLRLRQLGLEDAQGLSALRSHEKVNEYLDRPKIQSLEEARQIIQSLNQGVANNSWIFWAITYPNSDQLIGTICIWNISKKTSTADIGYELHPDYQGKGIMQEALLEIIDYGFKKMKLKKLQAFTHKNNSKSLQLLIKNGFTEDPQGVDEAEPGMKGMVLYSLLMC